jgi:selenocysteine-specific elongation factor
MHMPLADLKSHLVKAADKKVAEALVEAAGTAGTLVVKGTKVTLPGYAIPWKRGEGETAARIEQVFKDAGNATPLEAEACAQLRVPPQTFASIVSALLDSERLVRLNDKVTYHADTVDAIRRLVGAHIAAHGTITVAQLRDVMNVSRKYTLAILEHFDTIGFTRRVGDARVLK